MKMKMVVTFFLPSPVFLIVGLGGTNVIPEAGFCWESRIKFVDIGEMLT